MKKAQIRLCLFLIDREVIKQKELTNLVSSFFGAGSRGRTDTVLLPSDFESDASANSTIPANGATLGRKQYYIIQIQKNQYVLLKNF